MTQQKRPVNWQTRSGEPVRVGDVSVTPQSQALGVRWPGGGCVWNRPIALLVEREGRTRRLPIIDVTRAVQLALYGLSMVFVSIGLCIIIRQHKEGVT